MSRHAVQSSCIHGADRNIPVLRPLCAALAVAFTLASGTAWAQLPSGAQVVNGSANIVANGPALTISNSPNAILDWQSFSIGAANSVRFQQENAASQVLNRVVGQDASLLLGSLSSNGRVWLVNPHGVLFGQGARVDVAGLVASTLAVSNGDFLSGRGVFGGATDMAGAQVLNQGQISTTSGGRVWLIGDSVRNEGLIQTPGGQIMLAAGKSIELIDSGAPNLVVRLTAPENEVLNLGSLIASGAGSSIDLHGGIVNQQGIIRADSVGADAAGRILLRAQGGVSLGDASLTSARAAGSGKGGQLIVESTAGTTLVSGELSAASALGQGGQVQLLGDQVGVYRQATVEASGASGGGAVLVGGDYQGSNPLVRNAQATYVGPDVRLSADATAQGDGGKVIVWSDSATRVYGSLSARGGSEGGDGGLIETSGAYLDARPAAIDATAAKGKSGTWLLDPNDILITTNDGVNNNIIESGLPVLTSDDDSAVVDAFYLESAIEQGLQVIIRTGTAGTNLQFGDITVASNVNVGCVGSTNPCTLGSLTLEAHRNITVNSDVQITSTNGAMPLSLQADSDGNNSGGIVIGSGARLDSGGGSIALHGLGVEGIRVTGATIDSGSGVLSLTASGTVFESGTGLSSSASGDAITVRSGSFNNLAGAGALNTPNGRWLVHTDGASSTTLGGLQHDFVQFNVGDTKAPAQTSGNGLLYSETLDLQGRISRGYDGTVNAVLDASTDISGAPAGYQTSLSVAGAGSFADKHVGSEKPISVAISPQLGVTDVASKPVYGYSVSYTGDITPAPLTISAVADSKIYDGNTDASLSNLMMTGVLAGDNVSVAATGSFGDANVGDFKLVGVNWSLNGVDAGNYTLNQPVGLNASITPAPLTITAVAYSKIYDGNLTAGAVPTVSGLKGGDTVSGLVQAYTDKNVGSGKALMVAAYTIEDGNSGRNYDVSLASSSEGVITPEQLWVQAMAQDKVYDGNTDASLSNLMITGVVAGDNVSVSATGSFGDANVGDFKLVGVNWSLNGVDAGNYTLNPPVGLNASITPAPLNFLADPSLGFVGQNLPVLSGKVSGFVAEESWPVSWTTTAENSSPSGLYPVYGGVASRNYYAIQAERNNTALTLVDRSPTSSPEQANRAVEAATASMLPLLTPPLGNFATVSLVDFSSLSQGNVFGPVNVRGMSFSDLAGLLESRREFKRKLFADSIDKLELDPSLADVKSCASAEEAGTGLCRITPELIADIQTKTSQAQPVQQVAGQQHQPALPLIQRKIAVLFGINDYGDRRIPKLESAIPDVDAVSRVLTERLGYETRVLRNPGKADIIRTLNQIALETRPADSVLIYYAGHGYSLEKHGAGYWIPADAPVDDPTRWLSNADISRLLSAYQPRQTALVSDSCYSGAFAREALDGLGSQVNAQDVLSKRSVVVLSSGGDEPVTDEGKEGHSIFAWNFMQSVNAVQGWTPGNSIFQQVQTAVKKEFPQTPQYGAVTAAGHQRGGEYLFEVR